MTPRPTARASIRPVSVAAIALATLGALAAPLAATLAAPIASEPAPAPSAQAAPIGGVRAPKEPQTAEELVKVEAGVVGEAAPKGTVRVAATFAIHPGWHIYWVNSGDSGMPTQLSIDLPEGCALIAEDGGRPVVDFPVPQVFSKGETTFGYERSVTLSFEVRLPEAIPPGGLPAKLKARWLVCKESCLMGQREIAIDLARPVAADVPLARATAESLTRVPPALPAGWKIAVAAASAEEATLVIEAPAGALSEGQSFRFLPYETPGATLASGGVADSSGALLRTQLEVSAENAVGGKLEIAGILVVGKNGPAYTFRTPIVLAGDRR